MPVPVAGSLAASSAASAAASKAATTAAVQTGLAAASVAATVGSTVLSVRNAQQRAKAEKARGIAAKLSGDLTADQLNKAAGQERALAQRRAREQRRLGDIAGSNLRAKAAASGGDTLDPTVLDLEADISGESEFRALNELFEGEDSARGLEFGAQLQRVGGVQALQAGGIRASTARLRGVTSVLSGFRSTSSSGRTLLEKFG